MSTPLPVLYTVGYAPHDLEAFAGLLLGHGVTAVADVRSSPYSAYKREFSKKPLAAFLKTQVIEYVFLGDMLGARCPDPATHAGGIADHELIAAHPTFRAGLERLLLGMGRYTVTLLCAEADPLACHRAILVCRHLRDKADIRHIRPDGSLETHGELEERLLARFRQSEGKCGDQHALPGMEPQRCEIGLEEAYRLQGREIAWRVG